MLKVDDTKTTCPKLPQHSETRLCRSDITQTVDPAGGLTATERRTMCDDAQQASSQENDATDFSNKYGEHVFLAKDLAQMKEILNVAKACYATVSMAAFVVYGASTHRFVIHYQKDN